MFYLTTHLTHFYLWLYGVRHMVKNHSDSEREETCCHHMGYSFRLTARVLLYAPSHRQDSTYHGLCYTSRGALAGTRNSPNGSTPWRIDPTTHRTMSERSYHGATSRSFLQNETCNWAWCAKKASHCTKNLWLSLWHINSVIPSVFHWHLEGIVKTRFWVVCFVYCSSVYDWAVYLVDNWFICARALVCSICGFFLISSWF